MITRFGFQALLCCTTLVLGASALPAQTPSIDTLRVGFATPPPQARLRCYWWWLNGHTDKPTITHDLEEMKAKGFGGALLVDADGSGQEGNRAVTPGPLFGSPAWVELYTHALREADRLGLEITLNITSGWNLGSPDVKPDDASKLLTWTRTPVTGGSAVRLQLAAPASRNGYYRQIAVLAYPLHTGATLRPLPGLRERSAAVETGFSMPDSTWMLSPEGRPKTGSGLSRMTENDRHQLGGESAPAGSATANKGSANADARLSEVIDLTAQTGADGTLDWTPPSGEWEVLRVGYTNSDAHISTSSGAWQGHVVDYLSRDAFNAYWDHTVEPLLAAARPFHSLKYLASDSWELGGTNWTQTFAAEFRTRRGYDPLPWLPVVAGRIVESPEASTRFLSDLRRTAADLIAANHYDQFAARAAAHGLGTQAESGGPHGAPIDALETFRHATVVQTEFWSQNPHRSTDDQRFFLKEAASAANVYGHHLVAAEGETSIQVQWAESLAADLKPSFDMAVTEGMNRLVWHEFTSSPAASGLPGQEYFAGTHLNPKVTWWNAGGAFFTYLNRVQFMMQQGTPANDLLYFYGDNIPAFVRDKSDDPAHLLPGYDYDVVNEDALLNHLVLSPSGGTLESPETHVRWHILMLPQSLRLSSKVLLKLEAFVQAGGVVIGLPPVSPSGQVRPEQQQAFDAAVRRMWGTDCSAGTRRAYGKGALVCNSSAHEALATLHVLPDVEVVGDTGLPRSTSASAFDYTHRHISSTEVYFVRNGSGDASDHDVIFRSRGTAVELWDAVSGETQRLSGTRLPDGRTRVHLSLPAFGSAFVIFREGRPPATSAVALREAAFQAEGWMVSFQPDRGAPDAPIKVSDLTSWTTWPQEGVRYFSGSALYRTSVQAPTVNPKQPVYLQLTDVREVARVRVNGHDAGSIWAQPYTLRVDRWLHPGRNTLEIEVTNLWPNRIIGDLQPNVSRTYTSTNITSYKADSKLLPSGLIGPVRWLLGVPTKQ